MTLFKRGSVWWSYVWEDGVRHAKSTGTGTRRLAETIDRQHKDEIVLKRHRLPELRPEMTFAELSARFIAEGMSKPHSLGRLKHLLPFFESYRLEEITKAAVRRYRQERHSLSTVTVATVNRDLGVLRRLLYWALEEGFIAANPLARLHMERERRTKRPVLSVREENLLLASASDHLRRITLCALLTGMRRGEILGQQWEDIDFDNRLLYVSRSKTPEGEMREIPLAVELFNLLLPLRKESGTVFTLDGDSIKNIKTGWAGALRRSKIRHVRFHDLRHTMNTRMMLAGVMQEVRREILGHTSRKSRDVNDRYSHVELPVKRDAIRKLEAWLDAQAKELEAEQQRSESAAPEMPLLQPKEEV